MLKTPVSVSDKRIQGFLCAGTVDRARKKIYNAKVLLGNKIVQQSKNFSELKKQRNKPCTEGHKSDILSKTKTNVCEVKTVWNVGFFW